MPRYLIEGEGVSLWSLSLIHKLIIKVFPRLPENDKFRFVFIATSQETKCFGSRFICFWIFLSDIPIRNRFVSSAK